MPETEAPTVLPGFSIALGSEWSVLDLSALPDSGRLAAEFDRLVADGELGHEAVSELLPVLGNAITAARNSRVSFMAFLAASDDDYGALLATLTVSYAVRADAPPSSTTKARARPGSAKERRVVEVDGVETVRLAGFVDVPVAPGVRQRVRSVQYLIPTDDPAVAVIATATSSAVELAEALDGVFDQALCSVRVERD